MGEYFNWVNVDKKEYLCPADFDLGNKRLESLFRGNSLLVALHTLLADEWNGDHILFLGDECPVPDHPDCEALRILNCDTKKHHTGHYYDTVVESYRNVSGLFYDAETEVRQEIQYYLDDFRDYNGGKRTELPVNEYGINSDRPFEGLFTKKGTNFPYIINYTKKVYYSFALTRILQKDRSENTHSDPLPLLLEYGHKINHGTWVGDRIGVSNTITSEYKEGLAERLVDFTSGVNLIHSEKNSRGKTTLLRFMLYSLGYNIPNTRRIKFDRCEVTTTLFCEKCGDITLFRCSNSYIVATLNGEQVTYVLPDQLDELHRVLYGTDNAEILDNLLGVFYVDQEKGWTLLNRGTVIGSVHFNIEELVRGISGRDCSELIRKETLLAKELSKYKQMFSVAQYRETIIAESGSLAADSYYEEADVATNQLLIQQKRLKTELTRIDYALKDNKRFRNFVAEMKLMVRTPDGDTIPVTIDNVVDLSDTIDFLVAKRKIIASELASVTSKIAALEKEKDSEEQQIAFFQSENMVEIFDKKIAAVPINAVAIEKEIKRLEKALQSIRKEITDKTKANNSVVSSLYRNIVKYATELGVGNSETIAASYIFTSNLKELSGAVLHKTVFAFRLAYIIEIENALGIKLPIILDSPSGKEVDQENIQLMVDILKHDFADNQIIIASIFSYDFDEVNTIEIVNRLIE